MNKKNNSYRNQHQPVEEQFQAYGEYTYTFQHDESTTQTPAAEGFQQAAMEQANSKPAAKPVRRKNGSTFFRIFALLTILSVGLVVVLQTVFRLEAVCVIGHQTKTAQEVINASGLTYGQSIFSIRAEDVARQLEKDHTLIFRGLQVKHPNLVYLQVEERVPVAVMQWLGVHYVLDKDGLVMDDTNGQDYIGTLPVITGIRVSNAHKGQFLTVKSQTQMDAYSKLIQELHKQDYAHQVTEIRLNDPERIYLITVEGISVHIGKPVDLKRKIQAIRTTMSYLRGLGEDSGVMDVSDPEDVKYSSDR